MKRALVAGLLFAGFLSVASYAYAWEINADSKLGVATYREEYGIIESDWLAFYSGGIISLGHYPEEGFIGGADFGMGFTPNADEDWEITGRPFQANDMRLWEMENNFELGYIIPVLIDKIPIAPLFGYGWRFTRFKRENFAIADMDISSESVEEDFWVHHLDAGLRFSYKTMNEKFKIDLRGIFGFILYSSAYNNAFDTTIEGGDGSFLIKIDLGVSYEMTEHLSLNVAGFTGIQHLEGSTSGNIVWPDNDLNTYGGKIGIKYIF